MDWLTEHSRRFLELGYLEEEVTPEQRIREIADRAEEILKIDGEVISELWFVRSDLHSQYKSTELVLSLHFAFAELPTNSHRVLHYRDEFIVEMLVHGDDWVDRP